MMMTMAHIAVCTDRLERLRDFYVNYLDGKSHEKYENPKKGFASYFVYFERGAALEIMQRTDVRAHCEQEHIGLAHIAFDVRSKEEVDKRIETFRQQGFPVVGEPRMTGDGYYEGVILDPDGNRVELVAFGEPTILPSANPPLDLLEEADPDLKKIAAYLRESSCFVAQIKDRIVGAVVVKQLSEREAEIMNLAVNEFFRGRGIARRLLRHVASWAAQQGVQQLIIRTSTTSAVPLLLYQQEGFDVCAIDRDYFIRAYAEPLWENGVRCRHQVILKKRIFVASIDERLT